jgi:holo-[acyl-carrier protein] synthase
MVVGHGIDLVEMTMIAARLEPDGTHWLDGAFTEAEQQEADPPPKRVEYYAGRYAAKEAVAKALGTGFTDDVTWLDIEVLRHSSGAPYARLSEGALAVADDLGVTRWFVSISHRGGYAVATAIAVSEPTQTGGGPTPAPSR